MSSADETSSPKEKLVDHMAQDLNQNLRTSSSRKRRLRRSRTAPRGDCISNVHVKTDEPDLNPNLSSGSTPRITKNDLEAADLDEDGVVGAAEFILYKLKKMGKIDQKDITGIMGEFEQLDYDESGTLTTSDIMSLAQTTFQIQSSGLQRKITNNDLEAADLDSDEVVGAAEFIFYKLREMGKIDQKDFFVILEEFEQLDYDKSGTLTSSDITLAQIQR